MVQTYLKRNTRSISKKVAQNKYFIVIIQRVFFYKNKQGTRVGLVDMMMLSIYVHHHPHQLAIASSEGSPVKRTSTGTGHVVEAETICSEASHIIHRPQEILVQ